LVAISLLNWVMFGDYLAVAKNGKPGLHSSAFTILFTINNVGTAVALPLCAMRHA
jgi:hypothetical protein